MSLVDIGQLDLIVDVYIILESLINKQKLSKGRVQGNKYVVCRSAAHKQAVSQHSHCNVICKQVDCLKKVMQKSVPSIDPFSSNTCHDSSDSLESNLRSCHLKV